MQALGIPQLDVSEMGVYLVVIVYLSERAFFYLSKKRASNGNGLKEIQKEMKETGKTLVVLEQNQKTMAKVIECIEGKGSIYMQKWTVQHKGEHNLLDRRMADHSAKLKIKDVFQKDVSEMLALLVEEHKRVHTDCTMKSTLG